MSFEQTTLGEYAKVQGGYAYKSDDFSEEGGCIVLKIKNVRFGHIDYSDASFIAPALANDTKAWQTKEGDILISMTGSGPNAPQSLVGRVARVWRGEPDAWINQRVGRLVLKDPCSIHPDFLFYILSTNKSQDFLVSNSSGSANQANISGKIIESLPCPKIDYQSSARIAEILKTLDEKVLINRQTNQTLEQIAQAMFKSWFVDFEPTRAKIAAKEVGATFDEIERAAMRTISGKTPDQLAQLPPEAQQKLKTTAALFPDALVDSELGEIPEGWEIKTIAELSNIVAMGPFGSNIKVETFVDEGIPIINGQQLKGTLLEDGENRFISYEHAAKLSKANVFRGDIVITHRGTLGQVSIIPEGSKYERYIVSQSQCYIRPDKEIVSPLFLIFYFKSESGQHELLANKSQVGVPSIAQPVTNLRKIRLVVANKNILDEFQKTANSVHKKISKNLNEINYLENIRDALLPKLLSGELTVATQEGEERRAQ